MADEVHGTVRGGNGEQLQVTVGSKSIGLQTKDLVPILLLILIGLGGYLFYTAMRASLDSLVGQHRRLEDLLDANALRITAGVEQTMRYREEQTAALRKMLEALQYNLQQNPENRIPLEAPVPKVPHAP